MKITYETLNTQEMAIRIRVLRKKLRYSLAEVGRWFDVPRQTVYLAEKPEKRGEKLGDLRARIYKKLKEEEIGQKVEIEWPVFIVS